MEIWTEYEGRTVDGAFPLKKLLLPEGRSAFFSTSNGKGVPTVIRLIASHFDEEEILARWRGVEALGHPNILKIEKTFEYRDSDIWIERLPKDRDRGRRKKDVRHTVKATDTVDHTFNDFAKIHERCSLRRPF